MMIKGSLLNIKNLYIGQWIQFSDEAYLLIKELLEELNTDLEMKEGYYYIQSIHKPKSNKKGLRVPTKDETYKIIYIKHETWDPDDISMVLNVNLNIFGDIIMSGVLLIEDGIYEVYDDVRELVKQNSTRFTCAACENSLNIILTNVRICSKCEK